MSPGEYFALAILSIFWPLLIAIVVVALRTAHPVQILSAFLVGGLLTTIGVGLALVFALQDAKFFQGSRPSADPPIYIVVGLLCLISAWVLRGMKPKPKPEKPHREGPSKTERYVANPRVAFVAGVVLNIAPGFFPLVALKNIAEADYHASTKVALVVVFYVIMFALVEVPIVSHVIAPARTAAAVQGVNDWLSANGRRVAVWILTAGGGYLVVRGLLEL